MSLLTRIFPSLTALLVAAFAGHWAWDHYLHAPWTRDGRVRAGIVVVAPDMDGRITDLRVANNQSVRAGQLLFQIDEVPYKAAVRAQEAKVDYARQALNLARMRFDRSAKLLESRVVSDQDFEEHQAQVQLAEATLRMEEAQLDAAREDLARTRVLASADGTITATNLEEGNFVKRGAPVLSLIRKDSFYVTGYFEETKLSAVHEGQKATMALMSGAPVLQGHVAGISGGVANANVQHDGELLPEVQQVFSWVRLPQRIPVDIVLDRVPDEVALSAGMSVSIRLAM